MADMRRSSGQQETLLSAGYSEPDYPWGLRITLEAEDMEKLGIEMKQVGDVCTFTCQAKVTDTHQSDGEEGTHKSMSLQITEMSVAGSKEGEDGTLERMYSGYYND